MTREAQQQELLRFAKDVERDINDLFYCRRQGKPSEARPKIHSALYALEEIRRRLEEQHRICGGGDV